MAAYKFMPADHLGHTVYMIAVFGSTVETSVDKLMRSILTCEGIDDSTASQN